MKRAPTRSRAARARQEWRALLLADPQPAFGTLTVDARSMSDMDIDALGKPFPDHLPAMVAVASSSSN